MTARFATLLLLASITCQVVFGQMKVKELKECQTELGVTDNEVSESLGHSDKPYSTKIQCFLKCLGEKFGIYKDGKLLEAKIMADIKENAKTNPGNFDKEMKVFNDCKDKSGKDACETAGNIYKCVVTATKSWIKTK